MQNDSHWDDRNPDLSRSTCEANVIPLDQATLILRVVTCNIYCSLILRHSAAKRALRNAMPSHIWRNRKAYESAGVVQPEAAWSMRPLIMSGQGNLIYINGLASSTSWLSEVVALPESRHDAAVVHHASHRCCTNAPPTPR